ncbi:RELT-like protein 2 [Astyanax mexicanus]|uniref:RELT-like protein 2 n=1 Tax=Astyanax mexicanus TaxID=7994 RepID=UPI0020CAE864|nr:RELT-like protein 2 [Astyanax mexicanus]
MTDQEAAPAYMIFILVFCFFITGLLGFIFCHVLKDRGYRCRTGEPEDEESKNTYGTENYDDDDNEDTVERILKCIIENEANMEAFSEMLGNQTPPAHHNLRFLRKESVWSIPSHHHTIHMGDLNFCHHCGRGHAKKTQCRTNMIRTRRAGEQTVLSVGRFRVTHMEKKSPPDSANVTISESRDHPDLLVPLDGKSGLRDAPIPNKESYNIRNMFKNTEAANPSGPQPSKPKRRDSLPVVRRGSGAVGRRDDDRRDSVTVGRDGIDVGGEGETVGRGGKAMVREDKTAGEGSNAVGRVSDAVGQNGDTIGRHGDAVERDGDTVGRDDDAVGQDSDVVTIKDSQTKTGTDPAPDNSLNSDQSPENNPQ